MTDGGGGGGGSNRLSLGTRLKKAGREESRENGWENWGGWQAGYREERNEIGSRIKYQREKEEMGKGEIKNRAEKFCLY